MKLKLDENLPESLLAALTALGHDADNVRMENLRGKADAEVWQAAQKAGRFLITQDLDFSDIRKFSPGSHHGLMLVRLRLPGRLSAGHAHCQRVPRDGNGIVGALFRPAHRSQAADSRSPKVRPCA